jgi:hypothetical protein
MLYYRGRFGAGRKSVVFQIRARYVGASRRVGRDICRAQANGLRRSRPARKTDRWVWLNYLLFPASRSGLEQIKWPSICAALLLDGLLLARGTPLRRCSRLGFCVIPCA